MLFFAHTISSRALFSTSEYRALGGSPIEKIALTKFLLAIAQAAATPEDDNEWAGIRPPQLSNKCLQYLEKWYDKFFLYGDNPFLQMPAIKEADLKSFGIPMPEISTGNTTVLFQSEVERSLTEADKVLLLVRLMGCALGGKQTDNSVVLSPGYTGKTKTSGKGNSGEEGPLIGKRGYLHSFLQGNSLQETLWLNLFPRDRLQRLGAYPEGVGVPPWEEMPKGEDCSVARRLKSTLMGRLVPLSRFCLIEGNGLHYSDGIAYPGYKEGGRDPSFSLDVTKKDPKVLWTDSEKRPWRSLPALLSLVYDSDNKIFECYQIGLLDRVREHVDSVGIWSGGLSVRGTAGEQKVTGTCDYVESVVWIPTQDFGKLAFSRFSTEMSELDRLSKIVIVAVRNYFKDQRVNDSGQAASASNLFWQLCELRFQDLLTACLKSDSTKSLRPYFARIAERVYSMHCPRETARQIEDWARNLPEIHRYLTTTQKEAS